MIIYVYAKAQKSSDYKEIAVQYYLVEDKTHRIEREYNQYHNEYSKRKIQKHN